MSPFSLNLAVPGRFHYHNYVPFLWSQGVLRRFYYSHRFDRRVLPPGSDAEVNLWLKTYGFALDSRLSGYGAYERVAFYNRIWESQVLHRWRQADLWHVLLHGASRRVLRRATEEGSRTLGEPVNAHPWDLVRLHNEEAERLGFAQEPGSLRKEWGHLLQELEGTDYLLAPSGWIKRSFASHGYPAERILVCPYGVDLRRFAVATSRQQDEPFRVLCVGQVIVRKGQVDLLEAWKRLRLPHAELLLLGLIDQRMQPVLDRYSGFFRYLGSCSFEEVAGFYRQAAVLVHPSIEDGFAVVCGEAMASGLPVIVTENTGAADIVEQGVNGFVVPIRSPEKIAEYLELLYRNPDLCRTMGENAARTARKRLGWDRYVRELIAIYRRILDPSVSASFATEANLSEIRSARKQ